MHVQWRYVQARSKCICCIKLCSSAVVRTFRALSGGLQLANPYRTAFFFFCCFVKGSAAGLQRWRLICVGCICVRATQSHLPGTTNGSFIRGIKTSSVLPRVCGWGCVHWHQPQLQVGERLSLVWVPRSAELCILLTVTPAQAALSANWTWMERNLGQLSSSPSRMSLIHVLPAYLSLYIFSCHGVTLPKVILFFSQATLVFGSLKYYSFRYNICKELSHILVMLLEGERGRSWFLL